MLPELPQIKNQNLAVADQRDWQGFRSAVYQGAGKVFPEISDAVLDRLSDELSVIEEQQLLPYFNFWLDIFEYCYSRDITTGPGRGTINCSLVAHCLGMTQVNPIQYKLPLERFFDLKKPAVPAFSLDVAAGDRGRVIDYLKEKYGEAHVAAYTGRMDEDSGAAGNTRIFSHAGSGMVISAQPILPTVPTMRMRDTGELIVDFPVKHLQNLGCFKFDIHGLKSLEAFKPIAFKSQQTIYPKNWNDPNVIDYLLSPRGKDIFPFHSDGIRQLLNDFQPENLEELALVYALHRPGLIEYSQGMLSLRNSDEDAYFPHGTLYEPLSSTNGYLVYKEQFIEVVEAMSGFSKADAAAMLEVLLEDDPQQYATKFIDACEANGIDMEIIQQVMTELIASQPFLYSKAHAIGAAMIGYTVAWQQMNDYS